MWGVSSSIQISSSRKVLDVLLKFRHLLGFVQCTSFSCSKQSYITLQKKNGPAMLPKLQKVLKATSRDAPQSFCGTIRVMYVGLQGTQYNTLLSNPFLLTGYCFLTRSKPHKLSPEKHTLYSHFLMEPYLLKSASGFITQPCSLIPEQSPKCGKSILLMHLVSSLSTFWATCSAIPATALLVLLTMSVCWTTLKSALWEHPSKEPEVRCFSVCTTPGQTE